MDCATLLTFSTVVKEILNCETHLIAPHLMIILESRISGPISVSCFRLANVCLLDSAHSSLPKISQLGTIP